jgi:hypothetical protein
MQLLTRPLSTAGPFDQVTMGEDVPVAASQVFGP